MINPQELVQEFTKMYQGAVNYLWFTLGMTAIFLILYGIAWIYVGKRSKV